SGKCKKTLTQGDEGLKPCFNILSQKSFLNPFIFKDKCRQGDIQKMKAGDQKFKVILGHRIRGQPELHETLISKQQQKTRTGEMTVPL
ncbi:hypothetical protein LEMLEM_LOCUS5458, partial [Lemmus lemmus]